MSNIVRLAFTCSSVPARDASSYAKAVSAGNGCVALYTLDDGFDETGVVVHLHESEFCQLMHGKTVEITMAGKGVYHDAIAIHKPATETVMLLPLDKDGEEHYEDRQHFDYATFVYAVAGEGGLIH